MSTLYTIGHGDRPLQEFMQLLEQAGIEALVDVRAHPDSRRNPRFSEASLRAACDAVGVIYHWAGRQLGGMRKGQENSPHVALQDEGMRGYADYMDTAAFQTAAAQLLRMGATQRIAIMCAEKRAQRCHRWLIADYLALQGGEVVHIIGPGQSEPHQLSAEARRESVGLVYDRHATGALALK